MKVKIDPEKWQSLLRRHTPAEIAEKLRVSSPRVSKISKAVDEGREFRPYTVGQYERRLKTKIALSPAPVAVENGAAR